MNNLPRRMMLKAMGALATVPAVAPAAITRAIGAETAGAIMGAVSSMPAPPGAQGRGLLGNVLWGQFRRAERVEYLMRDCRKEGLDPLAGRTVVLVDVSGSMDEKLSAKSDLKRIDAAAALASVINGDVNVFTFSHALVEIPRRRGMAGIDAVIGSQPHGATYLGAAIEKLNTMAKADRLIVITDEQSHDRVPEPTEPLAYMINVASYQNGVGYGRWTHLDGFSEQVIRYIQESEAE